MLIGVISDTHGLLRPEAVAALTGVELIIHAGDIGKPEVIDGLRALAPVTAVRGNCDHGRWAEPYPLEQRVELDGIAIEVVHDLTEWLQRRPVEGVRVVVSGHSHVPSLTEKDGVLYLNPGSAGRRRFKLPVSLALLRVSGGTVSAELVELQC